MRQDLSPKMKETTFFISENTRMDVWRIFKNDLKVVFKNPPVWVVAFLWSILILRKFFQNPPEVRIRQKTEDAPKMRRKKQAPEVAYFFKEVAYFFKEVAYFSKEVAYFLFLGRIIRIFMLA